MDRLNELKLAVQLVRDGRICIFPNGFPQSLKYYDGASLWIFCPA